MSDSQIASRIGIAASVVVHLAAMLAGLGYAGFLLTPGGPEQTIAVDLVTPQDVADPTKPDAAPPDQAQDQTQTKDRAQTKDQIQTKDQAQGTEPPASASPPRPASQDIVKSEPKPDIKPTRQATAARSDTPQPSQQPTTSPPQAAIRTPEPDISVRYPMNLNPSARQPGDFDAKASSAAQLSGGDIAAFRAQLKTCATLPPDVAADDKVVIVIRAQFLPDGRLATTPILIEASASTKGPLLMQAAITALQACQPYASLPANKYQEWKMLDLGFTPLDFRRG